MLPSALLATLSLFAAAPQAVPAPPPPFAPERPMTLAAMQERMEALFARVDANGDGSLSADEIAAARTARRPELQEAAPGQPSAPAAGRRQRANRGGFGMGMLTRLDADGDGAVSRAEMRSGVAARFAQMDANSDGSLDASERPAPRRGGGDRRRPVGE